MATEKTLLRLVACGSVDDGKSTLIGRLLYDLGTVPDDQLAALERDSKTVGTRGGELDFALLVDGLMAEREWIIDLRATRTGASMADEAALLPRWLDDLPDAGRVVPLLVADEMLGFVVLARPRTQVVLDWEVRDLLKTAARQAAGFLAGDGLGRSLIVTGDHDHFQSHLLERSNGRF